MPRPKGWGTKVIRVPICIADEVEKMIAEVRVHEAADLEARRIARIAAAQPPPFICPECRSSMHPDDQDLGVAHSPTCSSFGFQKKRR